jgi:hypothetical protein
MSKLKCVIVEDSEIQRITLERIIKSHPDLVLVTSFRQKTALIIGLLT